MSDPANYRTKEEVEEYKSKDPIEQVLSTIQKNKWANEKEIEVIDNRIKALVDESVKFGEDSPYPDISELYKDVYTQDDYPYIIE
jgi:pyruvate dehydrogenase E1 component alpha subunit